MVDKKGISIVLPYAQSNRLRGNIALGFSRKNPVEDNNRKFKEVEYVSLELQGGGVWQKKSTISTCGV